MADNQVAAAAASLPPASTDKEKVSPPLPVVDVDVMMKPASSLPISPPPLAVMRADDDDDNNKKTTTTMNILMVCLWAVVNAVVFAVVDVVKLNSTPCTKPTWLFRCVAVTDAAAAEISRLLYGELSCSAAAALAAALHIVLLLTTTTSRARSCWGAAAVDALAWVALAATVGIHCMEVASHRIFLAAEPGGSYFADALSESLFFAVDLLAGVVLYRSVRRLELGEQQVHDNAEV